MASQKTTQPLSKAGIAFFSSLCISTFSLGCWQCQRYFEKINLMKKRKEELQMEPFMLLESNALCSLKERISTNTNTYNTKTTMSSTQEENVDHDMDRGYRPISIQGQFLHEYEILVGPRGPPPGVISSIGPNSGRSSGGMSSSPQGYYVITPFSRCSNMGIVLINRGWIPRQFVIHGSNNSNGSNNNRWERPMGVMNVIGVATQTEQPRFLSPPHNDKTPNQLLWMDRKALEMKTQTTGLSPLLLTETTLHKNDVKTDGNNRGGFPIKPSIETVGEFKVLPSTHAGYAFTWFSLSGIGVFMTKKLITRGRA